MSAAVATTHAAREMSNYIGGSWVGGSADDSLDVINPADGALLARAPLSTADDVDAAVAAAQAALPAWSATPVLKRARVLFQLRQLVEDHLDDLAECLTLDTGKAAVDARLELARAVETIECACAIPQTMQGRALSQIAGGIDAETFRQPVGVCAAITPFNFPAMLPLWFLPFAIGCGNTFVLKPSEQTPLAPELLFRLIERLELLPGVVNLVHGGHDAVDRLLDSPGVDAVSFVGSSQTAQYIYERAAASGKRVQALGGAKNHMVVMPDAVIEPVAQNMAASAFGGAGQRCMAGSVATCVGRAWAALRDPLVAEARKLRVGNGIDPDVSLGPVVSPAACSRIHAMIDEAVAEGARLAVDGRTPDADPRGCYVGPTIIEGVRPDMRIAREEVFGPVLTVLEADTLDDAIAIVNRGQYGNGTTIFTESGAAVRKYREQVAVGMIGVNVGVAAPVAFFPFGGWKMSFRGDLAACGTDAVDFYTRKKTVTSRWYSDGPTDKYFVES